MEYLDFLERHQITFFGHQNPIQDTDLVALGLHELKQLDIQNIDISYHRGIWMISTDNDWIADLVGQTTQHYFLEMVLSPHYPNSTFVFGGMLIKHRMQVATYQYKTFDWTSHTEDVEKFSPHIGLLHAARTVLFTST